MRKSVVQRLQHHFVLFARDVVYNAEEITLFYDGPVAPVVAEVQVARVDVTPSFC